jgi:hypothetical protein
MFYVIQRQVQPVLQCYSTENEYAVPYWNKQLLITKIVIINQIWVTRKQESSYTPDWMFCTRERCATEERGECNKIKKTPWPESASELYRPSDRCLSAKLLPTFEDRGYHVVSVMDPYGRILNFLDRSHYYFFQVVPELYSRGWVDPVPDPLLLRKFGSAGNRTWTCNP